MIADEPGRLIESNIVLNLNPPSKIADTSWIQAGKSAWDWWSGDAAPSVTFKTGMNTATMKHYIDFASASGFPYMLIDAGWAVTHRAAVRGTIRGAGRHHKSETRSRHAGAAALRKREEREDLAVGALDIGGQIYGPGVSAVREVGHRRREDRLHEPRRPVDGGLVSPRGGDRPPSII